MGSKTWQPMGYVQNDQKSMPNCLAYMISCVMTWSDKQIIIRGGGKEKVKMSHLLRVAIDINCRVIDDLW